MKSEYFSFFNLEIYYWNLYVWVAYVHKVMSSIRANNYTTNINNIPIVLCTQENLLFLVLSRKKHYIKGLIIIHTF